ncbi:acetyl-CoA carboxylase biotin carboxyl carrier protein [Sphingomicrobium marinum]|uniref:acetyl-CoA carboxylase biotin carboxyl carrier protein n=1 Tax=Sphingomicrobium marinum TaxID=1227950 RepID=UPI002240A7A3|nr:acetyl-CoA carboxylase biotin carboxyl carrier protein [Sphingomicrobium marinum]
MAEAKKSNGMRVDVKVVRELAKMLSDNDLTEIEVEDGERKVRVRREGTVYAAPAAPAPVAAAPAAPAQAPDAKHASPEQEQPAPGSAPTTDGDAVKSPMVGTAYLASEPGAANFVNEGDSVKEGDTLLIIEAMKVMNPINAPRSGTIKKILIADAQPVEFEQDLVVIG